MSQSQSQSQPQPQPQPQSRWHSPSQASSNFNSSASHEAFHHSLDYLQRLAQACFNELRPEEGATIRLTAEDSQFTRLNEAKVRQSTRVQQSSLTLGFQFLQKEQQFELQPSFDLDSDLSDLKEFLNEARFQARHLPEQPSFFPAQGTGTSHEVGQKLSHSAEVILSDILTHSGGIDLCGLLTVGAQARGVMNHLGLNHLFITESFCFDFSCYTVNELGQNKATKKLLAGSNWDRAHLLTTLEECREELSALQKPSRKLNRGRYRAYLSPQALGEICGLLNWGALSYRAFKQGFPFFNKLILEGQRLSPLITLKDHHALGLAPKFNDLGELMPDSVILIENGVFRRLLTSSASAKEFSTPEKPIESTYSKTHETSSSLELATGDLPQKEVLSALGTGVYLNNLHYLNYSDPKSGRFTGMTRYACFWVEDGKLKEPIEDMRFDVSFYEIFGEGLERLTQESWILPRTHTYEMRSLGGFKLPGALIKSFEFTF